jgi:hypothetical protein
MIYRAGHDERRDVVAFCGLGNVGCVRNGKFYGHTWLRIGSNLIDFSVGDWRHESEMSGSLLDDGLGAIDWVAEPPEYFWAPWDSFMPPAYVDGTYWTPELGRACYTGLRCSGAERQQLAADDAMVELVRLALPGQLELAKRLQLKQRVDAFKGMTDRPTGR